MRVVWTLSFSEGGFPFAQKGLLCLTSKLEVWIEALKKKLNRIWSICGECTG